MPSLLAGEGYMDPEERSALSDWLASAKTRREISDLLNFPGLPPVAKAETALASTIPLLAAITKKELMPIITGPVAGRKAQAMLEKIFSYLPEKAYETVKKVTIEPKERMIMPPWRKEGELLGEFNPSTYNIRIREPGGYYGELDYADTAVHEILHNVLRSIAHKGEAMSRTEEELAQKLASRYMAYGAGFPPHPSLPTLHEAIAKPQAFWGDFARAYSLLGRLR